MTRLRGGSVSPTDAAVASDRGSLYNLSKLPPEAPEVISKNTIAVTDPAKVLPWNKDERHRYFNLLVKRYKNQLLYGCQEPNCLTPTCFSYRKRVTDAPVRRYTELSARTIAVYLASQDNPERGLCRNPPVTNIESLGRDRPRQASKQSHPESHHDHNAVSGAARPHSANEVGNNAPSQGGSSRSHEPSSADNALLDADKSRLSNSKEALDTGGAHGDPIPEIRSAKLRDPKSFTQNLFDTVSMKMVEWLPLPRMPDSFNSKTSSDQCKYQGRRTPDSGVSTRSQEVTPRQTRPNRRRSFPSKEASKPTVPTTPLTTNAQPTAVEVKLGQPVKRLSINELDQWRQPRRNLSDDKVQTERKPPRKRSSINTPSNTTSGNLTSPPPLKHRPQKQRHFSTDVSSTGKPDHSKSRRAPREGSKVQRQQGYHVSHGDNRSSQNSVPEPQLSPTVSRETEIRHTPSTSTRICEVQSLSHLSSTIIKGLEEMMYDTEEDAEKWKDEMKELETRGYSESWNWRFATARQRQAFPFVSQSIFYVLSNPDQLLRSFRATRDYTQEKKDSIVPSSLDITQLDDSFRTLYRICPWETALHCLWVSLENLFIPPKEFPSSPVPVRQHIRRNSSSASSAHSLKRQSPLPLLGDGKPAEHYVTDTEAAHILVIILVALSSSIPRTDPGTWSIVRQLRASGTVVPDSELRKHRPSKTRQLIEIADKFEHDLALRLVNRLARAISARLAFHEISKSKSWSILDVGRRERPSVVDMILDILRHCPNITPIIPGEPFDDFLNERPPTTPMVTVEWLRTLLLKEWDGKPEMAKSSAAGSAIQILSSMYQNREKLGLRPEDFHTSFFSERLDPMDMPVEWLSFMPNNRTIHLLSYPFLFVPSALVTYFRALNYTTMAKSYETAMTASRHMTQTAFSNTIPVEDDVSLLARLKTSISTYLILTIRRDYLLTDALDQLWRRERRELIRPLKVKMGMDEGEEGIDHGGVQQEFFRLAMAEALDPAYGMFTMDSRNLVSWFQPRSMEPLYKFELLGLLMSLAVYNGLTLPVNFPIALYRKLLGMRVKNIDHIRVGWPELGKGLENLLNWSDGDVGDIFMRTYEFSFETFGSVTTVDMEKVDRDEPWPPPERNVTWERKRRNSSGRTTSSKSSRFSDASMLRDSGEDSRYPRQEVLSGILKGASSRSHRPQPPSPPHEEAALVTNENRERYVKDYIFWLTDKAVRPQFEAFARGFYTCLDRMALSIFVPEALKTVVEGIQEINVDELEKHARYEGGFDANHRVMVDFWSVVKEYSQTKMGKLLEFVTASDRVPVNGISSLVFVIQRNGVDDERLPTSLTCFGRLLLPEYSTRDVLRERLDKALENSKGFGVA
ncbi:hypothetical protein AJ80_04129 [Polytolypa hystricis UAMH7299]|uniref:HECT-type E3 ubiquitin transferase n=1 Tax=Polytolypa hystricis (strain UAMH7299) TaxID=1447883 RepID=A0A2B7YDZ7_POLH7|nr:hypothetical protein AJ80_04129 [Polytolypa hystricis UAMH7299]